MSNFFCNRVLRLVLLYMSSLIILIMYSVLYGLTAKESKWLGAITSIAVIVLGKVFSCVNISFLECSILLILSLLLLFLSDWNMGLCLFKFELLKSRVVALFVAGTSRVFLICFGVNYWLAFLYALLTTYYFVSYGRNG